MLTDEFGARVKQVTLHRGWHRRDGSAPLSDLLGRLAAKSRDGDPIGFELSNSPLGQLTDPTAGAFQLAKDATLAEVSQSYVFLRPLKRLQRVKWIPGFIVEENYKHARAIAARMAWIQESDVNNPKELDEALSRRFNGQLFAE